MGRHCILNPQTGRMVYKTGVLGRNITKNKKTKSKKIIKKDAKKQRSSSTTMSYKKCNKTPITFKQAVDRYICTGMCDGDSQSIKVSDYYGPPIKDAKKCGGKYVPMKRKRGPIPGKYYGYAGAAKTTACVKTAGKTKGYCARPSARARFNVGDFSPVYYGGQFHILAMRANGSPYWKPVV